MMRLRRREVEAPAETNWLRSKAREVDPPRRIAETSLLEEQCLGRSLDLPISINAQTQVGQRQFRHETPTKQARRASFDVALFHQYPEGITAISR